MLGLQRLPVRAADGTDIQDEQVSESCEPGSEEPWCEQVALTGPRQMTNPIGDGVGGPPFGGANGTTSFPSGANTTMPGGAYQSQPYNPGSVVPTNSNGGNFGGRRRDSGSPQEEQPSCTPNARIEPYGKRILAYYTLKCRGNVTYVKFEYELLLSSKVKAKDLTKDKAESSETKTKACGRTYTSTIVIRCPPPKSNPATLEVPPEKGHALAIMHILEAMPVGLVVFTSRTATATYDVPDRRSDVSAPPLADNTPEECDLTQDIDPFSGLCQNALSESTESDEGDELVME